MLILLFTASHFAYSQKDKPNIVIIYVDDLGYGDIGVNGAVGVKTPNIDTLAENGLNFTDAHCSASPCTPSRYSLLTGSYAFRNNAAILEGDAPLIIDTTKETLPKMLQKAGYTTGVVGKWHLGLGKGKIDWNKRIPLGPKEVGFDYSFLIPATGDRVPCVFLENQKVVGLDLNDPITKYLKDFAQERDWEQFHSPKNLSMALSVECAELMEHFQWLKEESSYLLDNQTQQAVSEEVVDVLLYTLRLADVLNIDLPLTIAQKTQKNEAKYPIEKVKGSAKKYNQYE